MKDISSLFQSKGLSPTLELLVNQLSGSELNTLLLEVYRRKAAQLAPAQVLKQFSDNRFTRPSTFDPVRMKQLEAELLTQSAKIGYAPVSLSPLAPLGTCSAMGKTDQNITVSALRGTEVVSDATNVLALLIAKEVKKQKDKSLVHRYATVHQHVRAQAYDNPLYAAHFGIFCMVSGAFDQGNYQTEWMLFLEHLEFCYQTFASLISPEKLHIRLYQKQEIHIFDQLLFEYQKKNKGNIHIEFMDHPGTNYYDLIQFKLILKDQDNELDLADGGLVDWSQQMLSNRKHRLFISGLGTERLLMYK